MLTNSQLCIRNGTQSGLLIPSKLIGVFKAIEWSMNRTFMKLSSNNENTYESKGAKDVFLQGERNELLTIIVWNGIKLRIELHISLYRISYPLCIYVYIYIYNMSFSSTQNAANKFVASTNQHIEPANRSFNWRSLMSSSHSTFNRAHNWISVIDWLILHSTKRIRCATFKINHKTWMKTKHEFEHAQTKKNM